MRLTDAGHPRAARRPNGGGWGIRTPEGLHPTRFPIAWTRVQGRRRSSVCAGEGRCATKNAHRSTLTDKGNCYRNCYLPGSPGGRVIPPHIWVVRALTFGYCGRSHLGRTATHILVLEGSGLATETATGPSADPTHYPRRRDRILSG